MLRFLPPNIYRKQQMIMALASMLGLMGMIVWIEPALVKDVWWKESYLPFYVLFGLSCWWLLTAFSGRWKRSLLWSISLTGYLWLKSNQLDTIMTIGLLIVFNLVWAYYWKITNTESTSID